MYVRTPRLCSAYRHSSLSNITLTFFFAGRGGDRSGGAVCLLHRLCPLLRRCFLLDCSFRRPWRQPLWWGRVLASPPEPSASPLLRPRLFVPQAVVATALVGPCACFKTCAFCFATPTSWFFFTGRGGPGTIQP